MCLAGLAYPSVIGDKYWSMIMRNVQNLSAVHPCNGADHSLNKLYSIVYVIKASSA